MHEIRSARQKVPTVTGSSNQKKDIATSGSLRDRCTLKNLIDPGTDHDQRRTSKSQRVADREIAAAELPSAWYQLMKLREALDAILGSIGGLPVIISELSPEAPRPQARDHLRLVDTDQSDSARAE